MNPITAAMIDDAFSQQPQPQALLCKLEADGLDDLFFTNHPDGLTSGGQFYEFFPFNFKWHGASETEPAREAKIEITNRDYRISRAIRQATGKPKLTVNLVRVSAPEVIELALTGAGISDVDIDDPKITATLRAKSFATEPACKARYVYARTPGLF